MEPQHRDEHNGGGGESRGGRNCEKRAKNREDSQTLDLIFRANGDEI
jgi:hypothetical protein